MVTHRYCVYVYGFDLCAFECAFYWVAHYPMGNYVCEQLVTQMSKTPKTAFIK